MMGFNTHNKSCDLLTLSKWARVYSAINCDTFFILLFKIISVSWLPKLNIRRDQRGKACHSSVLHLKDGQGVLNEKGFASIW